jgi:serine/threonine-protein kinase RsbW
MSTTLYSRLRANPHAPSVARRQLQQWLDELQWPSEESEDLILAVSEAVSNSAEHAYRSRETPGPVELDVTTVTDPDGACRARIVIADEGEWRPPPGDLGFRGRGLPMIKAFVETCRLTGGGAGTRLELLSRPVRLGSGERTLGSTLVSDPVPAPRGGGRRDSARVAGQRSAGPGRAAEH